VSEQRVRLFTALELPDPVRLELAEWSGGALRDLSGVRLLPPAALHVTLCFLGWRLASEIEEIARACETVAALPAPQLEVGEPLWLPPRRPGVLAVAIADPAGALARLQRELSAILAAGRWYAPEARPFLAHVTVARTRRGARLRGSEPPPPPRATAFSGSLVTLYRSRLGAGGASYEPLRRVMLEDAHAGAAAG
jgi:2'-5' RNA ligase